MFTWIRASWLCGHQAGTPFWEYKYGFSDDMDPYIMPLSAFLETIETWEDEPGDELVDAELPAVP